MIICNNCEDYITTYYAGEPPTICEPCIKNDIPIKVTNKEIREARKRLEESIKRIKEK